MINVLLLGIALSARCTDIYRYLKKSLKTDPILIDFFQHTLIRNNNLCRFS